MTGHQAGMTSHRVKTRADDHSAGPSLWRPNHKQLVQGVLGMLLAIVLVVWGLPKIAQTTWGAVFDTLSHVGPGAVMTLFALMCVGLWTYTFTLTGSLPGLRHVQALIVNLCGSSAGNLMPGGGAAGVAVTYGAFRSWGFSRRDISTSIIVTGVWNILARMILPVIGLIALLVAGGNLPDAVVRGGLVGALAAVALLSLFIAVLASERAASAIARALHRVLQVVLGRFRSVREVPIDELVTDQRARIVKVVRQGWVKMTFGMIVFFAVYYVLFWQSLHFVGVRMTFAHMFAAYAVGRLLTAIGITPGGVGVTEGGTVAVLVAFGANPAQALAGAVLFSLFTHVMEVPLGLLAYLGWVFSKKSSPTDGADRPGVTSTRAGAPGITFPGVTFPGVTAPGVTSARATSLDATSRRDWRPGTGSADESPHLPRPGLVGDPVIDATRHKRLAQRTLHGKRY